MEAQSRYKKVKMKRLIKEVEVLNNLKLEAAAGNKQAAKVYNRIIDIRGKIQSFEYPSRGKKDAIDEMFIQLLREEEFFLINLEIGMSKPLTYLSELKSLKKKALL
jgi:hypothetical protein